MPEASRPGTATRSRSRAQLKPPSQWQVLLHNDDYTTQEFVVFILRSIFRKAEAEAVQIMMEVHRQGKGIAGVYTHEIAETKVAQVRQLAEEHEFPLLCTLEPA